MDDPLLACRCTHCARWRRALYLLLCGAKAVSDGADPDGAFAALTKEDPGAADILDAMRRRIEVETDADSGLN